jgi:catechol 2,3-dioxygenase-like lactoylglutathione lyase family enzyme
VGVLGVNHIAFRTPDPTRLKRFYEELFAAEVVEGSHDPLRIGSTLLVFFESHGNPISEDPDELAFDVDLAGFEETLARARELGVITRDPVAPTAWSRAFLVRDPDGRRIEITYDDRAVYWLE